MHTRRHFLKQVALTAAALSTHSHAAEAWKVGEPIVSYWAGPGFPNGSDLTDAALGKGMIKLLPTTSTHE